MKTTIPFLLLSLFSGACAMPSMSALPAPAEADPPVQTMPAARSDGWAAQPRSEPRLYARDGSVVAGQPTGTVAVTPNTGQSVAAPGGEGSRWTLLEQYQSAVKAKEELEVEVEGLAAALDQADARELQMAGELEQLRELTARYEARIDELQGESVELASRLTTAQIRRLQSEKLLLEAKLDWKKVQAVINQPATPDGAGEASPIPIEPGKSAEQTE